MWKSTFQKKTERRSTFCSLEVSNKSFDFRKIYKKNIKITREVTVFFYHVHMNFDENRLDATRGLTVLRNHFTCEIFKRLKLP